MGGTAAGHQPKIDDTMFSETLKSSDFLEVREVIIPHPRSAQVRSGHDTMFSEALEIFDFLEIREVIIPYLRSAQVRSRHDTMFSEALEIFDFLEIREVIIPQIFELPVLHRFHYWKRSGNLPRLWRRAVHFPLQLPTRRQTASSHR